MEPIMPPRIRACIDRIVPLALRDEALRVAFAENPQNQPPSNQEMAVERAKLWRPGRKLRVRFLEGSRKVQEGVEHFARQWTELANITLDFVKTGDAEIRIAFQDDGSWSAVGTDALIRSFFPRDEATMNYGWLTEESSEEEISGVVLHEFGHALGCIHEHQNPAAGIKWNKEVVYRDLGGPPNNWEPADVDANVFEKYSVASTNFTAYDADSIMVYAFPKAWTLDGRSQKENSVLSAQDKAFIARQYPRSATV
jgi:hypothetical protein